MKYQAVKSSSIHSIGYEPETKTLGVTFHTGKTYHYDNVRADTHANMLASESIGKYFHSHVRPIFIGRQVKRDLMKDKAE
jgi:hypothetical protein